MLAHRCVTAVLSIALTVPAVLAAEPEAPATKAPVFDMGKLLATGGVSQLEGAGGGGLTPWALISGYGTDSGIGGNAHATLVDVDDFRLRSAGIAVGLFDRVELSYARQSFDTKSAGAALGLGHGYEFGQDIWGLKLKLIGDAVYDQDCWLPQVAVGLQRKVADRPAVLAFVGARDYKGVDYYVSATKLFLDQSLLVNGTLRFTKANQTGLLGFGGNLNDDYEAQFEGSAALLLSKRFAVGVEYRTKPDNLGFAEEDNWADVFLAYFPTKNFSATLALVDLGDIATREDQRGVYVSLQAGF